MTIREFVEKSYQEHPELPEQVKEVERLWGDKAEYPDLVIHALLSGKTPEEVATNKYMDL